MNAELTKKLGETLREMHVEQVWSTPFCISVSGSVEFIVYWFVLHRVQIARVMGFSINEPLKP